MSENFPGSVVLQQDSEGVSMVDVLCILYQLTVLLALFMVLTLDLHS